ncbi:MAG: hypothetical protein ACJ8AI_16655 [Rhodopila sp.]
MRAPGTGADVFAANVLPIVRDLQAVDITTTRTIAVAMNDRGIATAHRGAWYGTTVHNLLACQSTEPLSSLFGKGSP